MNPSFCYLFTGSLQGSSERCLFSICSTLQNQLNDRALIAFVASILQQHFVKTRTKTSEGASQSCTCNGARLVDQLSSRLQLHQSIELLISLTFSRWISELLILLPYRLEVEVLFVNHSLATILLKEVREKRI